MAVHPLEALLALLGGAGQAAAGIKKREDVQTHEKELIQLRKEAEADLARQRGDIEMDIEELRQKSAGDREKFSLGVQVYMEGMRVEHNWLVAKAELKFKEAELQWKKTTDMLNRALTRDLKGDELDLKREELRLLAKQIEGQYPTSPKMSEMYQGMVKDTYAALVNSDNPATAALKVLPQTYLSAGLAGERGLQKEIAGAFKLATGKDIIEFMTSQHVPAEPDKKKGRGFFSRLGPPTRPEDYKTIFDILNKLAPGLIPQGAMDWSQGAAPADSSMVAPQGQSPMTIQQLLELIDQSQRRQMPTGLKPSLTGR